MHSMPDIGLPHPLSKFGTDGMLAGSFYADLIVRMIQDTVWAEPHSSLYEGAKWFLLKSERAYLFACDRTGIDAARLREHLRYVLGYGRSFLWS